MIVKAVIFDLDDTLISERQYIESGYRYLSKLLSIKTGIDSESIFAMLEELFKANTKNVFNRFYEKIKITYTKEDIVDLVEAYRNHKPDIQFYDDVLPCLEQLKVRNIRTGIITDGFISTQKNKLKVLEADKYFDQIIITEELGREYWKPHSKAFEIMRDTFKVEFENMVYVGDNPEKDFYIGSIYPIKTVRICRDDSVYKNKPYFKNIQETIKINNLLDLAELVSV
jgi:putative hydrolase of the HAD superfamily